MLETINSIIQMSVTLFNNSNVYGLFGLAFFYGGRNLVYLHLLPSPISFVLICSTGNVNHIDLSLFNSMMGSIYNNAPTSYFLP